MHSACNVCCDVNCDMPKWAFCTASAHDHNLIAAFYIHFPVYKQIEVAGCRNSGAAYYQCQTLALLSVDEIQE